MNINALYKITYGLYAVCSEYNNEKNGYISNTVFQVTAEPTRFTVCCSKENYTNNIIAKAGVFSVSALDINIEPQLLGLFGYKSGKDTDKFASVEYKKNKTGAPILLSGSVAWYECKIINSIDLGSHVLYIGDVIDCDIINDSEPLTYNYYRDVKKGIIPKNAPSYINKSNIKNTEITMEKYECSVCGYIYDPNTGDDANGIAKGIAFENLPEDWTCPVCGASKSEFKKYN